MSEAQDLAAGTSANPNPGDRSGRPRRTRGARWIVTALVAAVAVLVLALLEFGVLAQPSGNSIDAQLAQGRSAPAPPFRLAVLHAGRLGPRLTGRLSRVLAGGQLSLSDLRGIPVVLNIWASWCIPCQQEAPMLERAWRTEGRPAGALFVGLDQQDAPPDARAFIRRYAIDYVNVRDAGNDVSLRYGATGVPETYFINARGQVVDHIVGVVSAAALRAGIQAARTGEPRGTQNGGAHRRTQ